MKTEVTMERGLFDGHVQQKSKSGYFSATDLKARGDRWRFENGLSFFNMSVWLNNKGTLEFINALEAKYNIPIVIKGRGRSFGTWVHPYLFIDMALAISPTLKIEVYSWLHDELLKYRNDSGDSYKKMCGALANNCTDMKKYKKGVIITCEHIKKACNVADWQTATQEQLKLRDKIQENIALLSDVLRDNRAAISLGIHKAKQNFENPIS